jgi:sodium-dependent dicarboxylate transporter 2/3/5
LLGIAYATSVGGIGTIIGTPPNLFLASFVKSNLDIEISFIGWMGIGLPLVVVFLPIIWFLLTRFLYPIDKLDFGTTDLDKVLKSDFSKSMSAGEKATLIVFCLTAAGWICRPLLAKLLPGISDAQIAVGAACLLFVIPVNVDRRTFVMNFKTARKMPWGILIIKTNGVSDFIGSQVGSLAGIPALIIIITVVTITVFLTELTSNTATTATLLPILAGLAPVLMIHPLGLVVPAAIGASCAFMLPVATPPNAIVFSAKRVTIAQMCKAGLFLNIIGVVLITILTYAIALPLLGV